MPPRRRGRTRRGRCVSARGTPAAATSASGAGQQRSRSTASPAHGHQRDAAAAGRTRMRRQRPRSVRALLDGGGGDRARRTTPARRVDSPHTRRLRRAGGTLGGRRATARHGAQRGSGGRTLPPRRRTPRQRRGVAVSGQRVDGCATPAPHPTGVGVQTTAQQPVPPAARALRRCRPLRGGRLQRPRAPQPCRQRRHAHHATHTGDARVGCRDAPARSRRGAAGHATSTAAPRSA